MPSSQTYAPDGASKNNAQGQKNTISDPFTLNGNVYRTETVATLKDGKVISSEVKLQKQVTGRSGETFTDTAITRNGGKDWVTPGSGRGSNENKPITTSNTNLTVQEIKELQPGGKLNKTSIESAKLTVKKNGGSDEQASAASTSTPQATDTNKPDAAKTSSDANQDDISNIRDAAGKYKGRTEYPGKTDSLKYPLNMDKNQDCIKFTVIEYRPSKSGVGGGDGRPTVDTGKYLSHIVLPMPSGIVDNNPVDWGSGRLDIGTQIFSDAIMGFLDSGTKGAAAGAKKTVDEIAKNKDLMGKIIKAKTLEASLGSTNLLSRLEGLAFNPNLELLFGGPSLRNFSFSFKMTPRSEEEAIVVRNIIRTFKQTMSVKRSQSTFILKAPHTFKISYLLGHSGDPHPYLNRFKECALTNCSVNYAPDGQYMSYSGAERSMTAYELQLQFQELEPIFDDDYDIGQDGASGTFANIGY